MKFKYLFLIASILLASVAWSANKPVSVYGYVSDGHSMHLLDSHQDKIVGKVKPLHSKKWSPRSMAFSSNHRYAYVINDDYFGSSSIAIIDTQSNKQIGNLSEYNSQASPMAIAMSPDGKYGYIGEGYYGSQLGTIEIFDTTTNKMIGSIKNFDNAGVPKKILFTPDGKKAIVIVLYPIVPEEKIFIIDTATHSVVKRLSAPNDYPNGWYNDAVITPDGKTAYITSSASQIIMLDLKYDYDQGVASIPIPTGEPIHVAITPDGSKLYVVDSNAYVSIIDTKTSIRIGEVALQHPQQYDAVAISADGKKGYLAGWRGIDVFDVGTERELTKMPALEDSAIDIQFPNL